LDRLRNKDVDIKISTVYQVVAGNIADETILNEIIAVVEEYKKKQKELANKSANYPDFSTLALS
jgi:hypothetical protein